MSNNIFIKDGNNASVMVHSIEDGTSVHYHQTVLADTSTHVGVFVSGSQAAQAGMSGFVVALHPSSPLPAGTQHLGKVSTVGIVSVFGDVSLGGGSANIGTVSISPSQASIPVSIGGQVHVSLASQGTLSNDGTNLATAIHLRVASTPYVFNRNSSTYDKLTGTSVGLAISPVSIAPQTLITHVSNTIVVSIADKVSVAGLVSVHQNGTWNINALTSINSIVKVSVEGLTITAGGGLTVTIGDAVSTQSVPIAGRDTGGNVRQPLVDVDGTVKVAGHTTTPEYVFTRPADTTAYATGDFVGNSTTAGSVIPLSFPVSRQSGGGGSLMIRRARLITATDNRTTDRHYRLHIFNAATGCSVANGDNGVFAPSPVSAYCGYIDIPMFLSASTGAAGVGSGEINVQLAAGQTSISGFLEARVSIAPANAATYRTFLEIVHD